MTSFQPDLTIILISNAPFSSFENLIKGVTISTQFAFKSTILFRYKPWLNKKERLITEKEVRKVNKRTKVKIWHNNLKTCKIIPR